jgi:putative NADPH-quinone reductase
MGKRILLIQGHPDASGRHLCQALAESYAKGARETGHEIESVGVGELDFPLLRDPADWVNSPVPPALAPVQQAILAAEHLVIVFPLWLGDMPALLKGFLEQVVRPGFAFPRDGDHPFKEKALKGRSARVIVTMGMPALLYRYYYRAHSVRSLERSVLGFAGISPIDETIVGQAGAMSADARGRWLRKITALGRRAV